MQFDVDTTAIYAKLYLLTIFGMHFGMLNQHFVTSANVRHQSMRNFNRMYKSCEQALMITFFESNL